MTTRPVTVDISLVQTEDRDRSENLVERLRGALPELLDVPAPAGGDPLTRTGDGSGVTARVAVEAADDAAADRQARAAVTAALGRLGFDEGDYLLDVVV
ncbi:hypothetical protein [Kineococcus rubinsiae]|uniref:hypothetical protein n=1 Tax=Kineococcus rubinsiae TaxID=2609562 RepID=UPI001430AE24|nr:hypothetical protein [Kineococcus rubinsiae]NIZ91868.1 hypothetical protein [Kineococcus rubinsiae]